MIIKKPKATPPTPIRCPVTAPIRRGPPVPIAFTHTASVVIAVWNGWRYTQACLDSLFREAPDADVIVVDNGSTDETAAGLLDYPVRVIRFTENKGVAPAWNAGLAIARGDVLCVLNNDTVINPGGMQRLFEATWRTGIACWRAGGLTRDLAFSGFSNSPTETGYPDGCCLAFSRDVWIAVGEFDEGFAPAYGEDADWGLRAFGLGYTWDILPDILQHVGAATSRMLPKVPAVLAKNHRRLVRKHSGRGAGERILVRRWAALGDVLMALPTLHAVRRRWPLARIHFQTAPQFVPLLANAADANEVSSDSWDRYTRTINLDGAYECHLKTGRWVHPAEAFADVAGVSLPRMRYPVPATPDLARWAAGVLPEGPVYVACGLRSAYRSKAQWHEAGWLALARALPDITFVAMDPVAKPSVAENRTPTREFYVEPNVLDLTGHTPDLRAAFAALQRCQACVSVDSGLYHLAHAAGLPVLGLFAGVPAVCREPLTGPRVSIQGEAECSPCGNLIRCRRTGGRNCLSDVSGEKVAVALAGLLKQADAR